MRLCDLFNVSTGTKLDLNTLTQVQKRGDNTVNFVSLTTLNNGVSAIVIKDSDIEPISAGTITFPSVGGTLTPFVQPYEFYSSQNVFCLTPKREMSLREKIYYCICINKNKHKFNYGRHANRTFRYLNLPDEVPEWVREIPISNYDDISQSLIEEVINLNSRKWLIYSYSDLFEIKKGKRITKKDLKPGETPYVTSIATNNGVTDYIDKKPNHSGNVITINYDGSVGEAYYQEKDFYALDSVNVLYPKFKLNKYIAMFLISLIKKEKFKYSYGRKWHMDRMNATEIMLPVRKDETPDWEFMEQYIKSLPYSKRM